MFKMCLVMANHSTVLEAVGEAIVVAVDKAVVVAVDKAMVDKAVMNDGHCVGLHVAGVVHGEDLGRADRQKGHMLHVGNNLVGEVGLHTVDASHVETVDVGVDIAVGVDITVAVGISVAVGVAVVETNVASHGATSAAKNKNEELHVWFGEWCAQGRVQMEIDALTASDGG